MKKKTNLKSLQKWITTSNQIDFDRIPLYITKIVKRYLAPICIDTPYPTLLLQIESILSQITGFNRLKVKTNIFEVPANLYSLIFMPSGEGKDKPLMYLKRLIVDCEKDFNDRAKKYYEDQLTKIEEKTKDMSKERAIDYKEDNKPRPLRKITGDGTVEGLRAVREAYDLTNFGSTFVKISEFSNYIKSNDRIKTEFLSLITEIYDMGNNEAKDTKGEKGNKPVYNIPSNILFYSSLSGLYEGKGRDRLNEFFNRGLARRSFVCYPRINHTLTKQNHLKLVEKEITQENKAQDKISEFKEYFNQVYANSKSWPTRITTSETYELYKLYEIYNRERAKKINPLKQEAFRAELKNRHWKALKLAAILSAIESQLNIEVKSMGQAIYQAEFFGNHFNKFFTNEPVTDIDKLFEYFKENKNKWITTMMLRKQRFTHCNRFTQWFKEALVECENFANLQNFRIEKDQYGKSGMKYKLVRDTK